MSRRKVFAALMLVVGILFFAIPIVYDYRGSKETDKLTQEFEQILEEKQEDETETEESKEEETEAAVSEEDAAIFAEGDVIAILEIESLEIRYPVVEGCSSSDLNKAIGHMSETAMVGSAGNCVLCGHNGSRYGEFFTKLNQIELGDMVTLLDTSGELHSYEVVDGGVRPGVIISCDASNHDKAPQVSVVPLSTKLKSIPVHVVLEPKDVSGFGLSKKSDFMPEDAQTISKGCIRAKSGTVIEDSGMREEIDRALIRQFDLLPVARKMVMEELANGQQN